MTDAENYMRRALELAQQGMGYTAPNPMVGCVVVKDGRIISEGYHERYGEFHAERNALIRCTEDATGADLYVTLEPCCHYGKTPPCTEIIIEHKIARVFVGSLDSNPLVAGKGCRILHDAGIEVVTGILEKECLALNEVFYHFIQTKMPFVAAKYAMSLDGKIACASGDSKWVTNETSRMDTQLLRKRYSGIMCGIGTVLADDPMLNCRIAEGCDPVRVVCDSHLRIPLDCQLVKTAGKIPVIVAISGMTKKQIADGEEPLAAKERALQAAGVKILPAGTGQQVDLKVFMSLLGEEGIDSILLEGGGTLNASAFRSKIVNRVYAYIAPKIIGGEAAPSPVRGIGAKTMAETVKLTETECKELDGDFLVTGIPVYE